MRSLSFFVVVALLSAPASAAGNRAKNVIIFLADAAGLSTLNAASIHGHGDAQKLFVQSWPHVALSDTSTAGNWVSDSAAGMTAIVTGVKTQNGVISMGPDTERGKKDGAVLKTLLEYAEEKGLSTGVLSNVNIADATPAACYAHANDRRKFGEIFLQVFNPRFGDGVDVVIGAGRPAIYKAMKELNQDLDAVAAAKQRPVRTSLDEVPAEDLRPVVVTEKEPDVPAAARMALNRLARNRKGYFLMIEWDAHTDDPQKGLDNLVAFDKLIREIASKVNPRETLLLFAADHSFGMYVRGGKKGDPLLRGLDEWKQKYPGEKPRTIELPNINVLRSHTAEEIVVAATGPGAERVQGFMPNTRIFDIVMAAYGWPGGKK
ncbi:MAG: alkaline phosphatase [Bryobacteraceae bacterium]|nr:alkaline phosphatase [Bryobacteraceae bacterium]